MRSVIALLMAAGALGVVSLGLDAGYPPERIKIAIATLALVCGATLTGLSIKPPKSEG